MLKAVPFGSIVNPSLNLTVLSGFMNASIPPKALESANIFIPMPHLDQRIMKVKKKKLTQPKMAAALAMDMPGAIPPGKTPLGRNLSTFSLTLFIFAKLKAGEVFALELKLSKTLRERVYFVLQF